MADEDREDTYDPSVAEVDRGRMQGLGVGARDLARQDDPHGLRREAEDETGGDDLETRPSGPPGKPDPAYGARDADEVSFTQGAGGAGAG